MRARGVCLLLALWLLGATAGAQPIADEPPDHGLPLFIGEPADASPLPPKDLPVHPGLAPQGTIHVDLHNTGVTDRMTPLGRDPVVTSRSFGSLGTCLNFVFDDQGRLFAFCGVMDAGEIAFELTWLDVETLDKLARRELLRLTFAELLELPLDLGYMVFDADGRFIAIDRQNRVQWVGLSDAGGDDPELVVQDELDFATYVDPAVDKVAAVIPDYDGHLFYMTLGRAGADGEVMTPARIGVVDPRDDSHRAIELDGEIVENGLAVGPDGVFLLSDRALYGYRYQGGELVQTFRQPYERATAPKPGVISFGSGATPTLLGDRHVVITDNADDRIHLLVYDRRPDDELAGAAREVCRVPLFDRGQSANENTVLAHGRSMVVQNWYGAPESIVGGSHRELVPGAMRIDLRPEHDGCDVVWHTRELATPATLKLSTRTGLLYSSMLDRDVTEVDAFYGVALDFDTGETVFRVRLGVGPGADISFSPTYVGPDGAIYQPVRAGIVKWQDGVPAGDGRPDAGGAPGADAAALDGDAGVAPLADGDSGCGCRIAGRHAAPAPASAALLALLAARFYRRRRR